jgi:Domain of unknown function (DUF222)
LTIDKQDAAGMSRIHGLLDPEARATIDAVFAKLAAAGICNPEDEAPCVDGEPNDEAVQRDTRSLGQRNHDALKATGRSVLASGELAAIAAARDLFNPESSPEQVLASAEPKAIQAWQGLDEHLRVITRIAAVAAQFGCRPAAAFPQVTECALGDNFKVDDRALMCCAGPLVNDSWLFNQPDRGHRTSPFFRTALRLHSIESAKDRYRQFAESEFDRVHSGPQGGWIDTKTGQLHENPRPENPYRAKALT